MEPKVTEEQAAEALRAIAAGTHETEQAEVEQPVEQPVETEQAAETTAEPVESAQAESGATSSEPESDDVESLRKRLKDASDESERLRKLADDRVAAVAQRHAQSEKILRDRFLKKSSVADRALKTLRKARSAEGAPESEVDQVIRDIESSMNPDSQSYVPPSEHQRDQGDGILVLNEFLNSRGMTVDESAKFASWIQNSAANKMTRDEMDVAERDLGGFLIIAHHRFQRDQESNKQQVRSEAANAVRAVQNTQRAAARAASASPPAPRKPAGQPREVDTKKLTNDDISALVKEAFDQYR